MGSASAAARAVLALLVLFMACAPQGASGKDEDALASLIAANVRSTDVTVVLEISGAERLKTTGGYTLWRISATVLRSFRGDPGPGESMKYLRTMETEFPAPAAGSRHIVSFCRVEDRLEIPDEGYHFPFSPELELEVENELHEGK